MGLGAIFSLTLVMGRGLDQAVLKDACATQAKVEIEALTEDGESVTWTQGAWVYERLKKYIPENGISDCILDCSEDEECCHWWFDCNNGAGECSLHGCAGIASD